MLLSSSSSSPGILVDDGVKFGVTDVGIFGVESVFGRLRPREGIVGTADRKSVVTHGNDLLLIVYDARSYL